MSKREPLDRTVQPNPPMKSILHSFQTRVVSTTTVMALFVLGLAGVRADAAVKTWNGGGGDGKWQTGLNWVGGAAPLAGDSLIFTGNTRVANTNNFPPTTAFAN